MKNPARARLVEAIDEAITLFLESGETTSREVGDYVGSEAP